MSLNEEILKTIQKNIPVIHADELKKFINSVQDIEQNYKKLKKDHEGVKISLEKELTKRLKIEHEFETLKSKVKNLNKREKDLTERENQICIQNVKLEEANKRCDLINALFTQCLRNVDIRKTIFGDVPIVTRSHYNASGTSYNESVEQRKTTQNISEAQE